MAYVITNLDAKLKNYLEVNKDELIAKAIFNNGASDSYSLQTGVKNPTAIVRLDVTAPLQDGSSCGFSASGDDTFTDRILTPVAVAVMKEYCTRTLLNSWKASDIAFTAGRETMPYEEKVLALIAEQINKNVEDLLMNGDTNNGDLLDGLLTLIDADITGGVIPAANDIAKSTDDVLTRCQKLWAACPAEIMPQAEIWMSVANYKTLINELVNANLFHIYEVHEDNKFEMTLPGTTTVIKGQSAITTDDIIMLDPKNVYKGVDIENGEEEFDFWYDKSSQTFKLNVWFELAINYLFPEEIFINR